MSRANLSRTVLFVALTAVLLALPLYVDAFWLQIGGFAFAAGIGAIGLAILFGRVGQLSLAHAFFLAVGAYGYIWFASPSGDPQAWGLGLPSLVALPAAAGLAGLAGGLFSPIAGRLRGLYLGVASIALVFLGQHILLTAKALTGGYNGRPVPPLTLGAFQLSGSYPELVVLGVPFGPEERMWYVALTTLVVMALFARSVLRGRVGRAFIAIREGEVHAGVLGVEVQRYRAVAFVLSSVYAGLAGALLALVFQFVVPEYWGLMLSLEYLAMIVIGGQASVLGAIAGAATVSSLPLVLQRYGDALPGFGTLGDGGFGPAVLAQLLYGAMVVVILLVEPRGLAALLPRTLDAVWRAVRRPGKHPASEAHPGSESQRVPICEDRSPEGIRQ